MKYRLEEIGKHIKTERTRRGWKQAVLAKKLNITVKQISKYESGKAIPPIDNLFALCDIFDCELGYLLGEEDYSDGTKIETLISKETGLSKETMDVICKITGKKKGFVLPQEKEIHRDLLNKVFNSRGFLNVVEAFRNIDGVFKEYEQFWKPFKEAMDNMVDKFNLSLAQSLDVAKILEMDENDDDLPELTEEQITDVRELKAYFDSNIEKGQEIESNYRLARYDLHEAFERMVDRLYPRE